MDVSKNRLGMPTEGDKEYFNKMRNMNININPGLPIEKAPGMRKNIKRPNLKVLVKIPNLKVLVKRPNLKVLVKRPLLKNS